MHVFRWHIAMFSNSPKSIANFLQFAINFFRNHLYFFWKIGIKNIDFVLNWFKFPLQNVCMMDSVLRLLNVCIALAYFIEIHRVREKYVRIQCLGMCTSANESIYITILEELVDFRMVFVNALLSRSMYHDQSNLCMISK